MNWWQISTVLCSYGFFKEYRPSEPFISPFLTRYKNFTIEQINQEIYPLGTYFYLCLLVAVFLLTDFLRYKPVLVAGGISAIITWSLLVFGKTIEEMQVVEFFYGVFMASEVAYFTYLYAKVDKAHYQKVTSHARAAFLLGKASAGLSSQLFLHFNLLNYLELNYLTIVGVGIATMSSFLLPSVPQSIYFNSIEVQDDSKEDYNNLTKMKWIKKNYDGFKCNHHKCKSAFSSLYEDAKQAFTNRSVLQWSIWWAVATCGYLQVISYCQLLWEDIIQDDNTTLYHGYVECATCLLGAVATFWIGYLKIPWHKWGEIFLGVLTICQGCFLLYCAILKALYLAYVMHIVFVILYHVAITIATCEIAKFINERNYALIFGIDTFFALLLQTVLTAVVIDGLKISIRNQFLVYGGYHICIGIGFLFAGIFTLTCFPASQIRL